MFLWSCLPVTISISIKWIKKINNIPIFSKINRWTELLNKIRYQNKKNLHNPATFVFIEVQVPNEESERLCTFVFLCWLSGCQFCLCLRYFILGLFRQCGILGLFRQCGILGLFRQGCYFGIVPTLWYFGIVPTVW